MPNTGARILLLGGDTDHNVGDRAIVSALTSCIVAHEPAAKVTIVAGASAAKPIAGVDRTVPRGSGGLLALGRAAIAADRILVAGGGLFQDDDSRAKMPYWAARIAWLKSLNPRIAGHSVGAGPLRFAESRVAARLACRMLTSVSVRDRFALASLAACTSRPLDVVPDPAFMLQPAPRPSAIDVLRSVDLDPDRPLIAVALRCWFHSRGGVVPNVVKARAGLGIARDHARFDRLLDTVAGALTKLARRLDAAVLLMPSYNVAHEGDDAACEALAGRLRGVTTRLARIAEPELYKAVLGRASLVVSARMHPLILASGMGVPIVGLSYNSKFLGLFDQLGLPPRLLLLDEFPARWGMNELVEEAEAALDGASDLRYRAEQLGGMARERTIEAVFGSVNALVAGTADA